MLRFTRSTKYIGSIKQGYRSAIRLNSSSTRVKPPLSVAFAVGDQEEQALRYRNQKNPLVPSLVNLDVRWNKLDAGQQDDIIAYLEDKMRGSWAEMSDEEKRASHYVSYGNWGPRESTPNDSAYIYSWIALLVGISYLCIVSYKYSTYDPKKEVAGLDYDS